MALLLIFVLKFKERNFTKWIIRIIKSSMRAVLVR